MKASFDLAVIGSGFAGSLLAMIAKRLGYSVVLLERGKHPRFAIGESSTPLANLLLEELTSRYSLPRIARLTKWGTWQEHYPEIACGLKRGFSFFHHSFGQAWSAVPNRENELLVAASPHARIADVHWYRAEVDEFLVREAEREGVCYLDRVELRNACEDRDGMTLSGDRCGEPIEVRASFVVDASGPGGFLVKALRLPSLELPNFPATQALFTHFRGVRMFTEVASAGGETPYPIDDAALHHVFDGGWIWVLHFKNGLTSAGVAAEERVAERLRFQDGAQAWSRLLRELPSVQGQFANAEPQMPFRHTARLAFRSGVVAGRRWALLPSAAGFVDPLLSTGFPLTLLGVQRLARILEAGWLSEDGQAQLQNYARQTDEELLAAGRLIAGLYRSMGDFGRFSDLCMVYFAAASFSETAKRMGKPEMAESYLLADHPVFGPGVRQLLDRVGGLSSMELRVEVSRVIEPVNVAGLGKSCRRQWYPVDAEDLLGASEKVQSTRQAIAAMLHRSGFWNAVA